MRILTHEQDPGIIPALHALSLLYHLQAQLLLSKHNGNSVDHLRTIRHNDHNGNSQYIWQPHPHVNPMHPHVPPCKRHCVILAYLLCAVCAQPAQARVAGAQPCGVRVGGGLRSGWGSILHVHLHDL